MKNIHYILRFRLLTLSGMILLLNSCDSFVEVDLPSSQLTSVSVFEEKATANAAMTAVYSKLRDGGLLTGNDSGMSIALGAYADELTFYGTAATGTNSFFTNSIVANNGTISSWWSDSYSQIYGANSVYEGVAASSKLSQNDKDQLMGEALFVRALVHFYLVNLYGEIPYVTSTNYLQNQVVHKFSTGEVYTKIISDLLVAQSLLPADYFGGQRVRPNSFVATALLARVYLYHGDYAEAANAASAVMNESGTYELQADLDATFLKNSSSTIWQLVPQIEGSNTAEGANFIFNAGPPGFVSLTNDLVNAFEAGDLRKLHWTRAVTDGTSTWYHAYKYKQQSLEGTSTEYSIVFRLSEMYLIRSEARLKQGDLIGGKEDLNAIRNLAGLSNTPAVTQEELLDVVLLERRVEFFTEHGHRFLDLKRAGKLDAVLPVVKPGWDTKDALFPLPERELLLNPNMMPQNTGY